MAMLGRQARLASFRLSMQTSHLFTNESHSWAKAEIPKTSGRPLWSGFVSSAREFPDRPAVLVDGKHLTYAELLDNAQRVAATIQRHGGRPRLTGVLAYRSATAFTGVLGSLLAGNGYVPLNRTFPT